jgi:ATP-dependent protease Clp ATPase subunit
MEDFRCSFCDRVRSSVPKLICGPRVFICLQCVVSCLELTSASEAGPHAVDYRPFGPTIPEGLSDRRHNASDDLDGCSFCGVSAKDAHTIVHGYVARICRSCVGICHEICAEAGLVPAPPSPSEP